MPPLPEKILIIQTASIGDVILSTAIAESLHVRYPQAAINYLVKSGYQSLFDEHPYISKVWVWDKRKHKYSSLLKLARQIRSEHYDMVINAQRFFSSGLITLLSGAKITSGFRKNPLSIFFTRAFPHRIVAEAGSPHEVERNHLLISFIDGVTTAKPVLFPTPADYGRTAGYRALPYVTISPASLWFTKQYPEDKWIELVEAIPRNLNIILLGSKADVPLCERIKRISGRPYLISLAGQLSLLQSAALMKYSRMNYTNDSAPMHLASAVNAPVTAVFCSTVPEFGFGPLSDISHIVQVNRKLECRPCGLHGRKSCPKGHFRCANDIDKSQLTEVL